MKADEATIDTSLDATEGVMTVLQLLVLELDRSGVLNGAQFAKLLLDFRRDQVEEDSMRAVMIDRMLGMFCQEGVEVLIRRHALELVPQSDQET